MKGQILFYGKNKNKKKYHLLKLLPSMPSVEHHGYSGINYFFPRQQITLIR